MSEEKVDSIDESTARYQSMWRCLPCGSIEPKEDMDSPKSCADCGCSDFEMNSFAIERGKYLHEADNMNEALSMLEERLAVLGTFAEVGFDIDGRSNTRRLWINTDSS